MLTVASSSSAIVGMVLICAILLCLASPRPSVAQNFTLRVSRSPPTPTSVQEHHGIDNANYVEATTKAQRIRQKSRGTQDAGGKLHDHPEEYAHIALAHDNDHVGKTTTNHAVVAIATASINRPQRTRSIVKNESSRPAQNVDIISDARKNERIFLKRSSIHDPPSNVTQLKIQTSNSTAKMRRRKLILACSNVSLIADEAFYYEGEVIYVTYSITSKLAKTSENSPVAWLAVYRDAESTKYGTLFPPMMKMNVNWPAGENHASLTVPFSSLGLNLNGGIFRAVMGVGNSDPPQILGVSDSFEVRWNYVIATVNDTSYYEGELIHVTFEMNQLVDTLECGFAWVALYDVVDTYFSLPPLTIQKNVCPQETGNVFTVALPVMELPSGYSSNYPHRPLPDWLTCKVVMGITNSNRVLGFSSSFSVNRNVASLVTDARQYYKGESINVTYTMYKKTSDMEVAFGWIALFDQNVTYYQRSTPVTARIYTPSSGYSDTVSFSSDNLIHGSKYKAALILSSTKSLNVIGSTLLFQVFDPALPSATLVPTQKPITLAPTTQPTQKPNSLAPTTQPFSAAPTQKPNTLAPTPQPVSMTPTQSPNTLAPTTPPIFFAPTEKPNTMAPTTQPVFVAPTQKPSTMAPTKRPASVALTQKPSTMAQTKRPIFVAPTKKSNTMAPTTQPVFVAPTRKLNTPAPTKQPVSVAPTQKPTIVALTQHSTAKGSSTSSSVPALKSSALAPSRKTKARGATKQPANRDKQTRVP